MLCPDTAKLHDKLTGSLIGLARSTENNDHLISASTDKAIIMGLSATDSSNNYDEKALTLLIQEVGEEKRKMVPDCFTCAAPCGRTADYNMDNVWNADEDIRSLKSRILFALRKIATHILHAPSPEYSTLTANLFVYRALYAIGMDSWGTEELLPVALETEKLLETITKL